MGLAAEDAQTFLPVGLVVGGQDVVHEDVAETVRCFDLDQFHQVFCVGFAAQGRQQRGFRRCGLCRLRLQQGLFGAGEHLFLVARVVLVDIGKDEGAFGDDMVGAGEVLDLIKEITITAVGPRWESLVILLHCATD